MRIHSYGFWVSNVVQVIIRKSWCWRLYISGTITTTETWVAPFGSVTLALNQSKNGTRISFTVSEIFDRKQEPWTAIFLYSSSLLLLLAVRIHSNGYWFRSLVQVSIPKFWCWRRHISETIWTTETSFAPFGSATIALGHSENRTRISPTVSEIFDRKNSPERGYFFISRANSFERVLISLARTGQHSEVLMLTTSYLRNDMNDRNVVCTVW